jgi:mannose-1-phosphate guanylyltransferase/mannose-6-phosphate isomerase
MHIFEPFGKNTAPAILMSCLLHKKTNPNDNPVFVVASSDHSFDDEKFNLVINEATELAKQGEIVTLGVKPTKPETGYGYIKKDPLSTRILQFVEKPSKEVAEEYIDNSNYYWNSGTFIFERDTMIKAFKKHAKNILDSCKIVLEHTEYDDFYNKILLNEDYYKNVQDISIDYAIMEKIDNGSIVVFDGHWSDIGSWDNLHELSLQDENSNYINDESAITTYDTCNSYLHSDSGKLVVVGLDNVTVINHKGNILVCDKSKSQDIKKALDLLK